MKNTLFSFCLLLITAITFSQTMPTKAEMDKMTKQMKEAMKDLPPEAKQMMDSMGMKMPDVSKIPSTKTMGGMQKQYKDAVQQGIADKKAALAALPKKVLSESELAIYMKNCFTDINKMIAPEAKKNAENLYAAYNAKSSPVNEIIKLAAGLLLLKDGRDQAVWILAKLASSNVKNADALNSFSSVITMAGGPQIAIPILLHLNNKTPDNAIILNNLGQAYYGLDDAQDAESYLRFVLKTEPFSGTANFTLAKVADKKGNRTEAVKELKESIEYSYSDEKETMLKNSGSAATKKNISLPFVVNPDPVGLRNYSLPGYAVDVKTSVELAPVWDDFKSKAKAAAEEYKATAERLSPIVEQQSQQLIQRMLQSKGKGLSVAPFMSKLAIVLTPDVSLSNIISSTTAEMARLQELKKTFESNQKELNEKEAKGFPNCPGEGCNFGQWCSFLSGNVDPISSSYVAACNAIYEVANTRALEVSIIAGGALINNAIYSGKSDEEIEMVTASVKASFYDQLASINHLEIGPDNGAGTCKNAEEPVKKGLKKWNDKSEVPGCPIDLNLGLGPVSVAVNCKRVSIEGGEGLLLGGTYTFNKELDFSGELSKIDWSAKEIELRAGLGFGAKIGESSSVMVGLEAKVWGYETFKMGAGTPEFLDAGIRVTTEAKAKLNLPSVGGLMPNENASTMVDKVEKKVTDAVVKKIDAKTGKQTLLGLSTEQSLSFVTGNATNSISGPFGTKHYDYTAPTPAP